MNTIKEDKLEEKEDSESQVIIQKRDENVVESDEEYSDDFEFESVDTDSLMFSRTNQINKKLNNDGNATTSTDGGLQEP